MVCGSCSNPAVTSSTLIRSVVGCPVTESIPVVSWIKSNEFSWGKESVVISIRIFPVGVAVGAAVGGMSVSALECAVPPYWDNKSTMKEEDTVCPGPAFLALVGDAEGVSLGEAEGNVEGTMVGNVEGAEEGELVG